MTSALPETLARHPGAFRFSGFDALPSITVALYALLALPIGTAFGLVPLICVLAVLVVLALGMRVSITLDADSVRVTKKWLLIPYRIYEARELDDVWYGGDWGLAEGAGGVVLSLSNAEVHVGSSRSMRFLHDRLWPLSVAGRAIAPSLRSD